MTLLPWELVKTGGDFEKGPRSKKFLNYVRKSPLNFSRKIHFYISQYDPKVFPPPPSPRRIVYTLYEFRAIFSVSPNFAIKYESHAILHVSFHFMEPFLSPSSRSWWIAFHPLFLGLREVDNLECIAAIRKLHLAIFSPLLAVSRSNFSNQRKVER